MSGVKVAINVISGKYENSEVKSCFLKNYGGLEVGMVEATALVDLPETPDQGDIIIVKGKFLQVEWRVFQPEPDYAIVFAKRRRK